MRMGLGLALTLPRRRAGGGSGPAAQRRIWMGNNFDLQSSALTVGTITSILGGSSTTSYTCATRIRNISGRTLRRVRLLIPLGTATLNPTFTARVGLVGGGSLTSPAGALAQVTFGAANSISPADNVSYSYAHPGWILSDAVTLPASWAAGADLAVWVGVSGGLTKTLILANSSKNSNLSPFFIGANFSNGDLAASGSVATPAWTGQNADAAFFSVLGEWDAGDGAGIYNVLMSGDSTWAQQPPASQGWASGVGGWTYQLQQLAIAGGKAYSVMSGAQPTAPLGTINSRVQSLIDAGIANYWEAHIKSGWSWNSKDMGTLGQTAAFQAADLTLKANVVAAGSKFGLGLLAPPGARSTGEPFVDLLPADLTAYDSMQAFPGANSIPFMDVSTSVRNGANVRHFLPANSDDDVHAFVGTGVGQNLQAAAAYTALNSLLPAMGLPV